MKPILFISLISLISISASAEVVPATQTCTSFREYMTTLEFLRDHKEFSLSEADARKVALKVSDGCTGAAQRFTHIMGVLLTAGVGARDAMDTAVQFSTRTEAEFSAFLSIFKTAFLSEHMDLDIATSMRIAKSLSVQFDGDMKSAREDFEKMAEFCSTEKEINLPRVQCGELAAHVARQGQRFKGGMVKSFRRLFEFSHSDLSLSPPNALQLAETISEFGPTATENFIQAYKYAMKKGGLDLTAKDSLEFAKQIAQKSVQQPPNLESKTQ